MVLAFNRGLAVTIVLSCFMVAEFANAAQQTPVATKPTVAPASAPVAAPVSSDPELTTAIYGDWVLRCETAAQQKRVCEVASVISAQGQSAPIAQVVISKASPPDGRKLIVLLPVNMRVALSPKISFSKPGASEIELAWVSCTPGACVAITSLTDAGLAVMTAQSDPAKIIFHDAADREVVITTSFRGLAQAVAALAKE